MDMPLVLHKSNRANLINNLSYINLRTPHYRHTSHWDTEQK
jgi:hypothetical protein